MELKFRITVFTPTFNRKYIINNLYESLLKQSFSDFEWIIVDDGSSDATEELVNSWKEENKIIIDYYKQKNSGKHIAINKGLDFAKGELFFIVDSDDKLPYNSLSIINNKYLQFKDKNIAGVVGRKAYFNGQYVGSSDNFDIIIANSIDIRYKHSLQGDLAEVFRTEVLKKYPFPVFENEKFCPEALVWNRIAQEYNSLYFDEPIYQCEYLEDGLTNKITKIRMQSPEASMLHYSELESYQIPLREKIKANINFWRFSFNSKISFRKKITKVSLIRSLLSFPIGFLLYIRDKR